MQGVWHWAKGSLFPGQGVRQRSPAWEGGREGRRRDWGRAPQTKAPTGPRRRLSATSVATLTSAGPSLGSSVAARRPRPDPARCAPLLEAWAGRGGRPPGCPGPWARVRERVLGGAAQQLQRASPARAPPVRMAPPIQLRPPCGSAQAPPPEKLSTTQTPRPISLIPPHHTTPTPHGSAQVPPPEEPTTTQTPLPMSTPALHPLNLALTPIFAPIHSAPSPTLLSYIPRPIFFNHAPPTLHGSAHSPAS